jgi:lysophospholipase L1-like esterase
VPLLVAVVSIIRRRRPWRERAPRIALALLVALALARVPHPVSNAAPAEPAVPPLWLDTASWHPIGPHQSLELRGRPLASLDPNAESWLVVGGSVTYGTGVEPHQSFPAVAQDLLRAHGDRKVLLNGGVQGWNLHNIDRWLADLGDALPLRGIVVASILNNATLPIAAPAGAGCERSLLRAQLCNASRNQLLFTWPKAFLPKPHNPERYRAALRRLVARERALGRRVVLLDEATEFEGWLLVLWNAETYRAIAREVGAELGVPFHAVDAALAPLPMEQRFLDGIHPTAAAHALLGRRLAEILRAE